jgi:hypothetical protein
MCVIGVEGSSREVMLWQDTIKALVAVLVCVAKVKVMTKMMKDRTIPP